MDMPSLWVPAQQVLSLTRFLIVPNPSNVVVLFESCDSVTLTQELSCGDKAGSTGTYHRLCR